MSINSGDLRSAIEQLRPELSQVLGLNHSAFEVELDTILLGGTDNQLLDLFGRYPDAHEQLLDILDQQREEEATKGIERLFGNENILLPYLYYHCESGPHVLILRKVEKRDATGRALCPQHGITMSRISSEDLRAAIERLRAELPQLLGTNQSAFVTELDARLHAGGSDDELSKPFDDHPALQQRLLQVLA